MVELVNWQVGQHCQVIDNIAEWIVEWIMSTIWRKGVPSSGSTRLCFAATTEWIWSLATNLAKWCRPFQAQPTKVQESVPKFAEIRCQLITMKCLMSSTMSNRNSSVVCWSSKSDVIKRKGAKRFGLKSGFAGLPSLRLWIVMLDVNCQWSNLSQ